MVYIQWLDGSKTVPLDEKTAKKRAAKIMWAKVVNDEGKVLFEKIEKQEIGFEKVKFYAKIMRETEKAILAVISGKECWLPKSQIEFFERAEGNRDVVMIPDWLATKAGVANA